MSIIKELWLAIVVTILLAIAGSVTIHGVTTKKYVEEQLYAKNLDNASMLALTLSGLEKDPVSLDLFIMSQFDIGHYASISLRTSEGEVVSEHNVEVKLDEDTPKWFAKYFGPEVAPGVAQVSEGWGQYGTVYVESDTSFSIASMWQATYRLILGLSVVGLFAGIVGGWLMKLILKPLDGVVHQAQSFQKMKFIKLAEPRTLELKRVVKAMNFLANQSRKIMEEENARLDIMRYKTQFDDETDLANREYFISILKGQIAFRDTQGINCLFIIRFTEDEGFLRTPYPERRARLTQFVEAINDTLDLYHHHFSDSRVARMQKNEFAMLLTETHDVCTVTMALHEACKNVFCNENDPRVYQAVVKLRPDDSFSSALMRTDEMLDEAQEQDTQIPNIEEVLLNTTEEDEAQKWQMMLSDAIENCDVETFNYPVLNVNRDLVHYQSWAGVTLDGELRQSGYYTHWARYLGLLPKLELTTINYLIDYINNKNTNAKYAFLCSEQFILDSESIAQLYYLISHNEKAANQLCIEVRESTATRFPEEFEQLCTTLKAKHVEVGLKRVGESFSQLLNVQELGLDYVKIDSAFMSDIDFNPANHAFIRGFCTLAHTFGIRVYADGVKKADNKELFTELGIDGVVSHMEVIEHLLDD